MTGNKERVEHLTMVMADLFRTHTSTVRLVRVPLRICPLGAHIDHQLGLVTGMTIDESIWLAYRPNPAGQVRIHSLNFPPPVTFCLDAVPPMGEPLWANYVRGAARALQQDYPLTVGIDGVVGGYMPIGGLSSSAAVGLAYLLALADVNELPIERQAYIELDRYIENEYLGLNNGILDQSVILLSRPGDLTFVDCQTIAIDHIPSPLTRSDYDILVTHSGLTRSLVNTDYNQRVSQCRAAAAWLLERVGQPVPETPHLRAVPEAVFEAHGGELSPPLEKRARHFFTELDRVHRGVDSWQDGYLEQFGALVAASGESSIVNYECGSPHLISLYEILNDCPAVYGARFSGAGFRGACIGLSDPDRREEVVEAVHRAYPVRHPDIVGHYGVYFQKPDGCAERVEVAAD